MGQNYNSTASNILPTSIYVQLHVFAQRLKMLNLTNFLDYLKISSTVADCEIGIGLGLQESQTFLSGEK